ncbi:MAG TPA: ATP-dependent DNA helicase [Candidatus Diapherotrites archaeon]|uniref:ATP-dependent DNA helicase n=1 Tax=Candidatus Iainarchaeum sp. TaxID=3101447 RepID=A0A7J4IVL4_9ARCH|nr:ATP-dependent DNA helicase [Candidatus Diapherotrites archaeon]
MALKIYFPHESCRDGQKQLIKDIADAICSKSVLLANAPTGLGKTASSLAPALSYALQEKKKVFFLTPKSSQHAIAIDTANMMNKKFGLRIKTVDLVGKRKMCIHPIISHVGTGFHEACHSAVDAGRCEYYKNAKGSTAQQKLVANAKKAQVKKYGKSYREIKLSCSQLQLCPYEVTSEMVRGADLVVADYSHIFDDGIRESVMRESRAKLGDCILIIDEAHNLPKRIRDMLSTSLKVEDLERAAGEAKSINDSPAQKAIREVALQVSGLCTKIPFGKTDIRIEEAEMLALRALAKDSLPVIEMAMGEFMGKNETEKSYLLSAFVFLQQIVQEKKNTLHAAERKMNSLRLSLYPLDPSEVCTHIFDAVHSAVLMSGTLVPLQMYADVLGIEKAILREYSSPFPTQNRLNVMVERTTTKYTERSDMQFEEIASLIAQMVEKIPGNTIVYFPSFEILRLVRQNLAIHRIVLEQKMVMSQDEKEKLVKDFKALSREGGVMLAVSGGSIAEGIDFPGENLKAAIIVGIPFESVSLQSGALIEFYDKRFGKGWDYAYNAPAINRAIQAAGRVIRTENDRGVCIFLDRRFCDRRYQKFFPKGFEAAKTGEPGKIIARFFEGGDNAARF